MTFTSKLVCDSQRPDQPDYAVGNIIMRCVDDGPSDDRTDSISSHHQVIGRRCKTTITSSECNASMLLMMSKSRLCIFTLP